MTDVLTSQCKTSGYVSDVVAVARPARGKPRNGQEQVQIKGVWPKCGPSTSVKACNPDSQPGGCGSESSRIIAQVVSGSRAGFSPLPSWGHLTQREPRPPDWIRSHLKGWHGDGLRVIRASRSVLRTLRKEQLWLEAL